MEQVPPPMLRPFKEILDEVDRGLEAEREARTGTDTKAGAGIAPASRSVADILAERSTTHGDFTDHAQMTQAIKRLMRLSANWELLSDCQRESLEMSAHKIGRILSGNPNHKDHWDDIAGYATLVSQRI